MAAPGNPMPIRFRCSMCSGMLSISRRKAGTEVECPKCGYEVTVPEEDAEPEPRPAAVAPTPNASPSDPRAVARRPAPERPLFENSDFDRLLDSKVKQAATAGRPEPVNQKTVPVESALAEDGVRISRGALVILGVVAVVLIVLAFGVGFLAGS